MFHGIHTRLNRDHTTGRVLGMHREAAADRMHTRDCFAEYLHRHDLVVRPPVDHHFGPAGAGCLLGSDGWQVSRVWAATPAFYELTVLSDPRASVNGSRALFRLAEPIRWITRQARRADERDSRIEMSPQILP
jgi:hypothetical protein